MTAVVNIISPVLVASGAHLDGVTIAADTWVHAGTHSIDAEIAQSLANSGYVEIVSINGATYTQEPCCGAHR